MSNIPPLTSTNVTASPVTNSNVKLQKASDSIVSGSKIWNYFFGSKKSSAQVASTSSNGERSSSVTSPKIRSSWFFSPSTTVRIGGFMGFGGKVVPKEGHYEMRNEQRTSFSHEDTSSLQDSQEIQEGLNIFVTKAKEKVESKKTPLTELEESLRERESFDGYKELLEGVKSNLKKKVEDAKKYGILEEDVPWLMANNSDSLHEVRSDNSEKEKAFTTVNEKINKIAATFPLEVRSKIRRQLQCLCTQNFPGVFTGLINKLNCFKKNYFPDEGNRDYRFILEQDQKNPALLTIKVTVTTKNASKLGYHSNERLELGSKKFDSSFTLSCTATLTNDGISDLAFNSVEGDWQLASTSQDSTTPKFSRWWPF